MGLGGQNIDKDRRRHDAAEPWGQRDRDEVLLRRVTPRRLRVALKHVESA
jgi:hypothetical protein